MRHSLLMLTLMSSPALAGGGVYSSLTLHSSSEPVPVSDMVSGWDGDFNPGTYAYADGRITFGVDYDSWHLSQEQRWYYYLKFSKGTSVFYRNLEQNLASDEEYDLDLSVKSFRGQGIRLGKTMNFADWKLTPSFAYYRISEYQFGQLQGVSSAGNEVSASATLNYYFDEDKILEYQVDVPDGHGFSADLAIAYNGFTDWQLSATLSDLVNYWLLPDAGYTTGCINLGDSSSSVCSSSGSASGRSGQDDYSTQIPVTLDAEARYEPYALSVAGYVHGRYRRLSLMKSWSSPAGNLGVSVHTTNQFGLHWFSRYHELSLISDDQRLHSARDLQMNLRLGWYW